MLLVQAGGMFSVLFPRSEGRKSMLARSELKGCTTAEEAVNRVANDMARGLDYWPMPVDLGSGVTILGVFGDKPPEVGEKIEAKEFQAET